MTTNTVKTALLLGLLSGLLLVGGEAIAGRQGLYYALIFAAVMNFASYFFSDKIALSMYSAQPVTETDNPEVYRRGGASVWDLAPRNGGPTPQLWLVPGEMPKGLPPAGEPSQVFVV